MAVIEGQYGLARVDYEDGFVEPLDGAAPRSAQAWLRAMFEDAPPAVRRFLGASWRGPLRVRLGPLDAPGHVLGWELVDSSEHLAVLAAASRLGLDVRLVVRSDDASVAFSTYIHYLNSGGRIAWAPVGPVHRQIVPRLLRAAVQRD